MINLPLGTLIAFDSHGDTYTGFILGRCCYDGLLEDVEHYFNAYVVRHTMKPGDKIPNNHYIVVDRNIVNTVTEYPNNFLVMAYLLGHESGIPDDRVSEWVLEEWFDSDGTRLLRVVPKKETINGR